MPRTTLDLVSEVIEVDEDIDLNPFIGYANELVTELCTNSGYADSRLTSIETWLAAHFYAMRDPQVVMEEADKVRAQYESKVGFGFKMSRQGQQAMRLDTDGNLAALDNAIDKVKKILPKSGKRMIWLGECGPCEPRDCL